MTYQENDAYLQLSLQGTASKQALDDVGAIETVDAIGTEHALLRGDGQRTATWLNREIPHGTLVLGYGVDENAESIPSHLAALLVEIEGDVFEVFVTDGGGVVGERLLQSAFRPLLVHQIQQNLASVQINLRVEMFDESLSGGGLGTLDGRLGFVLQIGILIPIERHRAARLNEGILLSRGEFDDLFRFDVVGRVAFLVDPSHVISTSGSENGTT